MLSAGLISAVLGTRLPGPGTLYMRQSLRFAAPVKIGDTVRATVTITSLNPEKKRATLSTVCTVGDEVVIDGEAYVQVPSRS
jgi:3-hydroxybutyryl-CoA dehydratase